ncbi:MAG: hypothetical protein ABIK77_07355 [candidate division WOR-3 bacterium]|uniref:LytR family transcriptional regulator n=1 Tax=candidate division WOR-3 bacterium TaxID=2052148 RepID=A0A7C4S1Z1_UNCW3
MKKIILAILVIIVVILFFVRKNFKKDSLPNNSENLSIALINGSGDRLASVLFAKYLQKYNFSVSYVIEINDTFEKTVVVEHIDKNLRNGKLIQKYLCYKKPKKNQFWRIDRLILGGSKFYPSIELFLDSTLNLSVSIILGRDYFEIIKNGTN